MIEKEVVLGNIEEGEVPMKATLHKDGTATVELATGSVAPWRQNQGSSIYFSDTPLMTSGVIPSDFHQLVPIFRWYYANDAMFGTVVDSMVELAMDNVIKNVTEDKNVQEFFDGIIETSNLKKACRWAMLEYILLQNVFPYRVNKKEKVVARSGKKIPLYEWTVLNPEYTYVKGSLLFGDNPIVLKPNTDLKNLLNASDRGIIPQLMPKNLSDDLIKEDEVPLDPLNVYHIARHKQPFQRYAPTTLRRVLRPLKMKEIYMRMDISTANSVINQVIVFKLGSDKFPVKDTNTLKEFHRLISTNSKAYQLVWTHALEIDYVRADAEALDPKKYEFINRELLYGFAVPSILLGQSSERGSSNAYLAVKGMVERLTWAREDLEEWIEREFRLIAEENNLATWPKPKIGIINLEEERTFRQILLNLHQHGVLSGETLLEETGFDILTEIERLKIERDIRSKEGVLIPSSPFQKSKNDDTPIGVTPVKSPGRPDDTPEDEKRDKRDLNPQPSGSGSLLATASKESEKYQEGEIELYYLKLLVLYDLLKDSLEKDVKENGIKKDIIVAALLAFIDSMSDVSNKTFARVSDWSYSTIQEQKPDKTSLPKYLDEIIQWNDFYLSKLAKDIENQIMELKELEAVDYVVLLDAVLKKEKYRIKMFATEGIKKAVITGLVANHTDRGYGSVRWVCQFRNSCDVCIDRHGSIYPIESALELYPAHVNCQCDLDFIKQAHV